MLERVRYGGAHATRDRAEEAVRAGQAEQPQTEPAARLPQQATRAGAGTAHQPRPTRAAIPVRPREPPR